MRIHQLTVSAFGPFPGTHVVDFEELNDAGVFLVTGPTGAGKTSILDAVCFALFGQVPGGRGVKALRSDHAAPEAKPEVVLDFSLEGRRFVVRRTPEWVRPKRRGAGTTPEKASASLLETTGGGERLVSSRAQEVGHFLSDLLGMTAGQFQQVAMLPQGEFQTFLRASTQERHDVLQQLFRTERFTRIEDWVHDHSRRLQGRAAQGETAVRRLVDTMADRAGAETPAALAAERLAQSASEGRVLPWADQLVASARAELAEAAHEHESSRSELEAARSAHEHALRHAELSERRDRAVGRLARLDSDGDVPSARAALAADERAQRCLPVVELLDESSRTLADALAAHEHAVAHAPEVGDARADAQRLMVQVARLETLLPRERELREARDRLHDTTAALEALSPRLAAAQEAVAAMPARRRALADAVARSGELARSRPAAEAALEDAAAAAQAASTVAEAEAELADREAAARDARDAYADARERLLDVISRRLAGMAAELATGLHDGEPCQVCGSVEHPAPAVTAVDAVDHAAQLAATTEADALRLSHETAAQRVQETRLRLEHLRHSSGGLSPARAAEQLAARRAALAAAVAAEQSHARASAALVALEDEAAHNEELLRSLQAEGARRAAEVERLTHTAAGIESELRSEQAGRAGLAEAISDAKEQIRALEALAETTARLARAGAAVELHEAAALGAAREQGFGGLDEVRLAGLDPESRAHHRTVVEAHDRARREAEAVLADPAVTALGDHPADLRATAAALADASRRESAAARAHHLRQEVTESLQRLRDRLEQALVDWAPAREEFLTADAMARLVRGIGSDNQLQMRLSSYVLATRLDQVVAAANERLTHMREQRYLLERTGEAARRGSQAGLGLRVVDEWTGETRDPATLSGGETFVVSLALALGLSDVVSTESGGVRISTLFIDEGFGMLDLDTLDDVMDRLDGLRAGGRTVGVVSHVSELRNRIPTQLHVDKQRNGSSVSVTTLIA